MKHFAIHHYFNFFMSLHPLTNQDRSRLDALVTETEKKTGAQIVLSVVERCDDYPELPWKAFALGVAIMSLALLIMDIVHPVWVTGSSVLLAVVLILAVGAVCAILCIFVPGFARFFLHRERSEAETYQYAESLFLSRELFATSKRTGILILIGLFERQVVILPDTGLEDHMNHSRLNDLIDRMTPLLATGQVSHALEKGLNGLEHLLSGARIPTHDENELPNDIIEEKGV